MSKRGPVLAMCGFASSMLVVHGVIAWMSPLQGDDWRHWMWAAGHPGGWLADHPGLSEACGYVLARSTLFHVVTSPLIGLALLAGVFTLAVRRLPDPRRWSDVLGLVLLSSMIWVALPRAGAMWFHRPYVAAQIYGAAVMVWFAVPFRCRTRIRGPAWSIAMLALGLVAGTATRQLSVAGLVGIAIALWRTPRPDRRAWMFAGLAGLAISVVWGFARAPWREAGLVFTRLEVDLGLLGGTLRGSAQLIALIALLALAAILYPRLGPASIGEARSRGVGTPMDVPAGQMSSPVESIGGAGPSWLDDAPDAGSTLAWLGAWFGLAFTSLFGPRTTEATALPAILALCVCALPTLFWLARVAWARWVLVGLAVGVHLVAWSLALSSYAQLGAEYRDRMAAIARTPANQIATVRPYAQILPTFWSPGEDWSDAALRESLAQELWHLAGIDLAPSFRQLERSAGLQLVLEADGVSDPQLRAAAPPPVWARELSNARRQFLGVIERLRRITGRDVPVRLRITDVAPPGAASRPILAAWSEGTAVVAPAVRRSSPDSTSYYTLTIPAKPAQLSEAWAVTSDAARPLTCSAGSCRVQLLSAERAVILLCNQERCLAIDALVPRF